MAFILRNTKLISSLVGYACQTGRFTSRNKRILFLERPDILYSKDLRIRFKVSLAQKETEQDSNDNIDKLIYQLNLDIRRKNVLMKDLETIINDIQKRGEITNFELMILLKCCTQVSFMSSEKDRVEMAEKIWKTAENLGVQFNISHYNGLLDVFLDNNHTFSPSEFLTTLENSKLTPNIHTYRRLLKAYCQQGDLKGASNLLNKMKELNYRLNEIDFNALILGYSNTGELDKAEEILNVMQSKNVEPSCQTYVNLLCGYAKHGLTEKLSDTLRELPSKEIFLSDADMLEVLYALAVNNHGDKVDVILQEIVKSSDSDEHILKFIHRLFHKRLDSIALKLLDQVDKTRPESVILQHSKFVLDHFICYRSPEEILKMCDLLEKKDLARVPIAYTLKNILLTKDEEFIMNFFEVMKKMNIDVRKHYYWPVLIKASEKGNPNLLSYIRKIPKNVTNNMKTLMDYVFPNYKFTENWQEDLKLLNESGISMGLLTRLMVEDLCQKKKLDDVEKIVSSYPVFPFRTNHIFNILRGILKDDPTKDKQIINIIHKLAHDFYILKKNTSEDVEVSNFFDGALNCFLKGELDEEVLMRLLENMLEKKMNISHTGGSNVTKLYSSERVAELVDKLTDSNLKFEFDESLLSKKKSEIGVVTKQTPFKRKVSDSIMTVLFDLDSAILEDKFDRALKICELLYSQGKGVSPDINEQRKFRYCYAFAAKKGNSKLTDKLYEVGVSLGFLRPEDFVPVVRSILVSKNTSEAIDRYCEFVLQFGNLSGCVELLSDLVAQENVEGCQKIVDLVTDIRNKNTGLSVLVCAFIKAGNFEKAKKVLETPGFTLSSKVAESYCNFEAKYKTSEFFERFLELAEGLNYFRKHWVYKILAEKYVEEENIEKLSALWPKIPQDIIPDTVFLEQYERFMKNPSVERLSVFTIFKKNRAMNKIESSDSDSDGDVKNEPVKTQQNELVQSLAREGNVPELIKLMNEPHTNTRIIADTFFEEGKVEEYFKLVEHFISSNEFKKVMLILYPHKLIPYLKKDEYYNKYKSIALQCLEKKIVEPFFFYTAVCLMHLDKVEEVTRVLEQHSSPFKPEEVSFVTIKRAFSLARSPRGEIAENIISNEKLKAKFSHFLPHLYSSVLALKCKTNDTESIVHYLKMAKSDGSLSLITNHSLIDLIKKKLADKEISFSFD